ncbi:MAG: response regulator transcription factor [Bacteroidales bacterium]|nr:response regulator transcription factor [Bacteroidales bacterium]MCF8333711.1 response regulator transcription factor [Bacteroidales bacterium]
MKKPLSIVVLDDHSLFLKGISYLLREIFPEAELKFYRSVRAMLDHKYSFAHFDLFISDIDLPGEDVFSLFEYLKTFHPALPVLVISMHKKIAVIRKCKKLGIEGYILKNEDDLFVKAVKKVLSGEIFYSQNIEHYFRQILANYDTLSEREEDIIKLIAGGYINKDIANMLHISIETVKTHKKNIKMKLGVDNTQQIIDYTKKNYLL